MGAHASTQSGTIPRISWGEAAQQLFAKEQDNHFILKVTKLVARSFWKIKKFAMLAAFLDDFLALIFPQILPIAIPDEGLLLFGVILMICVTGYWFVANWRLKKKYFLEKAAEAAQAAQNRGAAYGWG